MSASTQSNRRSTVNGKITLRYSLRLYGPRSKLQMSQTKFANSPCVCAFTQHSLPVEPPIADVLGAMHHTRGLLEAAELHLEHWHGCVARQWVTGTRRV